MTICALCSAYARATFCSTKCKNRYERITDKIEACDPELIKEFRLRGWDHQSDIVRTINEHLPPKLTRNALKLIPNVIKTVIRQQKLVAAPASKRAKIQADKKAASANLVIPKGYHERVCAECTNRFASNSGHIVKFCSDYCRSKHHNAKSKARNEANKLELEKLWGKKL